MFPVSRRDLLRGAASAAVLAGAGLSLPRFAYAATLQIGILLPGSKADKGWMESGYDGMVAAQKKYGEQI